jgi:hypothetical protein
MASTAAMPSGVTIWCAWPGRGESVTELMAFMNCLVHWYTCCSDRHASPYWTFIHRWISMGFTPSPIKKQMTERCYSLVHVASAAAIFTLLLRRRVAFLHRTAISRPLFKPSVSLLPTYKTIGPFRNFYRPSKVFIWLFLVSPLSEVWLSAFRLSRKSERCLTALHGYLLYPVTAIARVVQTARVEMWCWRRMEKISWTDRVRNGEVLLPVREQRNVLREISKRKANWIGHILCRDW